MRRSNLQSVEFATTLFNLYDEFLLRIKNANEYNMSMNYKKINKHIEDIKNFTALICIFFNNGNLNRVLIYHNSISKTITKLKYELRKTDKTSLYEIRIAQDLLELTRRAIKEYEEVYLQPGYNIAEFDDFYESAFIQFKAYEKNFCYELSKDKQWFY